MTTEIIRNVRDDIDGSTGAETIRFSIEGTSYEIDLTEGNRRKLHGALQPFIAKARVRGGSNGNGESDSAKIRKWAADNRIQVNPKGRIPDDVMEKYRAAHPDEQ